MSNDRLITIFLILEVEHVVRNESDHTSLVITFKTNKENVIKPFKLLNIWLSEKSFTKVIKEHWHANFEGELFSLFHHTLKKVKKVLTQWSKDTSAIFS